MPAVQTLNYLAQSEFTADWQNGKDEQTDMTHWLLYLIPGASHALFRHMAMRCTI